MLGPRFDGEDNPTTAARQSGTRGWNRTSGLPLRRRTLYPTELREHGGLTTVLLRRISPPLTSEDARVGFQAIKWQPMTVSIRLLLLEKQPS